MKKSRKVPASFFAALLTAGFVVTGCDSTTSTTYDQQCVDDSGNILPYADCANAGGPPVLIAPVVRFRTDGTLGAGAGALAGVPSRGANDQESDVTLGAAAGGLAGADTPPGYLPSGTNRAMIAVTPGAHWVQTGGFGGGGGYGGGGGG